MSSAGCKVWILYCEAVSHISNFLGQKSANKLLTYCRFPLLQTEVTFPLQSVHAYASLITKYTKVHLAKIKSQAMPF